MEKKAKLCPTATLSAFLLACISQGLFCWEILKDIDVGTLYDIVLVSTLTLQWRMKVPGNSEMVALVAGGARFG